MTHWSKYCGRTNTEAIISANDDDSTGIYDTYRTGSRCRCSGLPRGSARCTPLEHCYQWNSFTMTRSSHAVLTLDTVFLDDTMAPVRSRPAHLPRVSSHLSSLHTTVRLSGTHLDPDRAGRHWLRRSRLCRRRPVVRVSQLSSLLHKGQRTSYA